MTICNKIQTVGETMETNLNARGVSCTFGTGTGESTVLDMVEMVNGTNFKGSSDVNLKISANRPYLLTGETTDVVVKLENGLCEPLKNKNVILKIYETINGVTDEKGEFALYDVSVTDDTTFTATYGTETATTNIYLCQFVDYGTTSKHNDNWANLNSYMTVTRNDMYTTLTPTVNSSQNRYILPNTPTQPFTVEFDKHNTSIDGAYFIIGNVAIQFSSSFSGRLANAKHLKFTVESNKITCEHDGVVEQTQMNLTSLNNGIRFQINNNNDGNVIQYNNFRVR